MRILFCASEIFGHAKSGGLADVGYSLPQAISEYAEIISVMPLYAFMDKNLYKKSDIKLSVVLGGIEYETEIYESSLKRVKTYFINSPLLSSTKFMYDDESGEYTNNDIRFGIFCAAVVELAVCLKADLIHANDWHSALVPLFVKRANLPIKTLFTIHNLAYQGIFDKSSLGRLGLEESYFNMDALEFYGNVNFLKAGIIYSDLLTTVSPMYAKEILTKEFGCGLDGLLYAHRSKLTGILNGIDTALFDPATDPALWQNYTYDTIEKKYENKKMLLSKNGLKDLKKPLLVMIGRLVHQKGFDLLIESLDEILREDINFLLLANGLESYKNRLELYEKKYKNFKLLSGYDEAISHRIYAGGDFLLMPSLFEPCGLNQMIAARYGTLPIVHAVGGLADSVNERKKRCIRGVVFSKPTKKTLLLAIKRALKLREDKKLNEMISFNMSCDLSFKKSALAYYELYKKVLS
jgi:starch synthase